VKNIFRCFIHSKLPILKKNIFFGNKSFVQLNTYFDFWKYFDIFKSKFFFSFYGHKF